MGYTPCLFPHGLSHSWSRNRTALHSLTSYARTVHTYGAHEATAAHTTRRRWWASPRPGGCCAPARTITAMALPSSYGSGAVPRADRHITQIARTQLRGSEGARPRTFLPVLLAP